MDKDQSFKVIKKYHCFLALEAKCQHVSLQPSYIENIERLGLIDIPMGTYLTDDSLYKQIEENKETIQILERINLMEGWHGKLQKGKLEVTPLGLQFINACVVDKA